jgi:phage repressor protein C with HTH and peptisase S24 domain
MPKMTFFDNRRKALEDYKKIEQLKNEQNPVKKAILEKSINNGKKQYINSLYLSFIELAARDNLNLNWVFYNQLPIHNNEEKIGKVVQNYYLSEHLNDDSVAIPYFTDIKASAGNGYINSEDKTSDFIVLPKSMISGKKLNAIKVYGDSMSPNIKPDSIILIDLDKKELKNNTVFALRCEDEVYVKRIEDHGDTVLLKSDNIQYSTIVTKRNKIFIIGQVVSTILDKNIE